MKELLLQAVVQEHIEMVKIDPQNVEVHAPWQTPMSPLDPLHLPSRKI